MLPHTLLQILGTIMPRSRPFHLHESCNMLDKPHMHYYIYIKKEYVTSAAAQAGTAGANRKRGFFLSGKNGDLH